MGCFIGLAVPLISSSDLFSSVWLRRISSYFGGIPSHYSCAGFYQNIGSPLFAFQKKGLCFGAAVTKYSVA